MTSSPRKILALVLGYVLDQGFTLVMEHSDEHLTAELDAMDELRGSPTTVP